MSSDNPYSGSEYCYLQGWMQSPEEWIKYAKVMQSGGLCMGLDTSVQQFRKVE
jgi:hypothetical protein